MNWNTTTINDGKLVLHCGGDIVTDTQLAQIPTPAPNGRHWPTDFYAFFTCVLQALTARGFQLTKAVHATSHDNARYFGLIGVESYEPAPGELPSNFGSRSIVQHVIGLRASHDKTFSNQLVMGTRVFVCDNLAFSGQHMLRRKNTEHAQEQLPELCHKAIDAVRHYQVQEENRLAAYRQTPLTDDHARASLVRCAETGAFGGSAIIPILNEFREPTHDEHVDDGHTLWTLHNAISERMKTYAVSSVPDRTMLCQRELDRRAGFDAAPAPATIIDID